MSSCMPCCRFDQLQLFESICGLVASGATKRPNFWQFLQETIMNAPATAKGLNEAWVERRAKAVARGVGMAAPIMAARAENSEIWDIEGRRYIDFAGGIAVLNAGHRNPAVMRRVQEQLSAFTHTCFTVVPYTQF